MTNRFALTTLFLFSSLAAPLGAQSEPGTSTGPRHGVSAFFGYGFANLAGGASKGGGQGGIAGLALELPISARVSGRMELLVAGATTDLGRTGFFSSPTKISVSQAGVGAGGRLYGGGSAFLGVGASVAAVSVCDVDIEGGFGFFGGETVDCADFEDIPLSKGSTVVAVNVSAGVRRGRLELEARLDQGLQASVESSTGAMRLRILGLVLHYRFGR